MINFQAEALRWEKYASWIHLKCFRNYIYNLRQKNNYAEVHIYHCIYPKKKKFKQLQWDQGNLKNMIVTINSQVYWHFLQTKRA